MANVFDEASETMFEDTPDAMVLASYGISLLFGEQYRDLKPKGIISKDDKITTAFFKYYLEECQVPEEYGKLERKKLGKTQLDLLNKRLGDLQLENDMEEAIEEVKAQEVVPPPEPKKFKRTLKRTTKPANTPTVESPVITLVETVPAKEETFEITTTENIPSTNLTNLPRNKEDVKAFFGMIQFIKKNIIDKSDIINIHGKPFIKRAGWRKFIDPMQITLELVEKSVYEFDNDIHAEVRIRASRPNGQSVEGFAIKSKSEFKKGMGYSLHNMVSIAWTRAENRAISNIVGLGEVSAEEMQ